MRITNKLTTILQLTIGLAMVMGGTMTNPSLPAPTIVANPPQVVASASPITTKVEAQTTNSDSSTQQKKVLGSNVGVGPAVREYFTDIPLMVEILKCESGGGGEPRQFDSKTGLVLRGRVNAADVGVSQINEKYHLARSKKLGYNIYDLQGNLAYARLLYEEQGPQPWISSMPCWGKSPLASGFKAKVQARANAKVAKANAELALAAATTAAMNTAATTAGTAASTAAVLPVAQNLSVIVD